MSARVTLVLAVLVMAASVFAWFDLRPKNGAQGEFGTQVKEESPVSTAEKPLVEFDPQQVDAIRIQRGNLLLQFRRDDGSWVGASSNTVVDDFLRGLRKTVEILAFEPASEGLAAYGLDPPEGSIELQLQNGPPIRLLLGGRNPAATGLYVRTEPERRVVLTGAILLWELDKLARTQTVPGASGSNHGSESAPAQNAQ